MTVAELIAELSRLPPDSVVVVSSDAEGNRVGPVDEVTTSNYVPDNAWGGELYERERKGSRKCVVVWPVN
jgi:hypothetical protein